MSSALWKTTVSLSRGLGFRDVRGRFSGEAVRLVDDLRSIVGLLGRTGELRGRAAGTGYVRDDLPGALFLR
jgi:hypothetical protein